MWILEIECLDDDFTIPNTFIGPFSSFEEAEIAREKLFETTGKEGPMIWVWKLQKP